MVVSLCNERSELCSLSAAAATEVPSHQLESSHLPPPDPHAHSLYCHELKPCCGGGYLGPSYSYRDDVPFGLSMFQGVTLSLPPESHEQVPAFISPNDVVTPLCPG